MFVFHKRKFELPALDNLPAHRIIQDAEVYSNQSYEISDQLKLCTLVRQTVFALFEF